MTAQYGLRVKNPSGIFVATNDGVAFPYLGQATLYSAGVVNKSYYSLPISESVTDSFYIGSVTPYTFRFTLPDVSCIPMVAARIKEGILVDIQSYYRVSGATWEVQVHSMDVQYGAYGSVSLDLNTIVLRQPEIHIFCTFADNEAVSGGYGMRLRNPTTGKIAFTTERKPMWIKRNVVMPFAQITTNLDALWYEDQHATWSEIAYPIVLRAGGSGYWLATKNFSGETISQGGFGLHYTDGNLKRSRYMWSREARSDIYGDNSYEATVGRDRILIVDGSIF